jgi:alcohol dehydrogenase class IV
MAMVYNFPKDIYFGWGESGKTGEFAVDLGCGRVLIVTDEGVIKAGLLKSIVESLESSNIAYEIFSQIQPNPTDENVISGLEHFRKARCDTVIAVGGGSPLDAAKGIILMSEHTGQLREYYSGETDKKKITGNVPLFMALPTTSGTGSEVSRGGIITDTEENRKRVISSKHLLPKTVVLDPGLTTTMPPKLTAHTGLDALSHSVEAYAVDRYSPICDAFALKGITLVSESLIKAHKDGDDKKARENMLFASTLGALAFQKGLGVVHSLAHQLSPQIGIPHGAACGIMLPHAIRYNLQEKSTVEKYAEVAKMLGAKGRSIKELAAKAPETVERYLDQLVVAKKLTQWGVTEKDIEIMARNAMLDHCHQRNPKTCSEEAMAELFKKAL